ncbi:MAG: 23S rRNA pseudouridine(1911/1915/1917) synthase RluD [Gammaproteobacteria bacterium]|jgi:23S rRNA pseudouridine1911/1915/1917 synthase|nr:23S rRNA pseudouridine(1911/1915/1917) synthase RluD [Gammaproteobacteria bacterium]
MHDILSLEAIVNDQWSGMRLDQIAALAFPDYSRSRLKTWIQEGDLTVDGKTLRPRDKLFGGEKLVVDTKIEHQERWQPQAIDMDIVFEDEHILVLNKPAGLVVHPAAGHQDGTLLNALLHHAPQLNSVPRAGIVHRLDKDTTGLMVVAKTIPAQTELVAQLQERTMGREYEAVAQGVLTGGGLVEEPIARHSRNRQKMAVAPLGKPATTHYRVLKRYRAHTHLRLKLETGRTHQIRVHMAHIGYPLLGDPLYGGRQRLPKGCDEDFLDCLRAFRRQALHAKRLELTHPHTQQDMEWEVPLPDDMQELLVELERDSKLWQKQQYS